MVSMVKTTVTVVTISAYWLHRLARPQWDRRILPVKELQPDLGHEAGVGGDQVQKAKEDRKSQRSLRHVAQCRHGLFREPKLVQAVGHRGYGHYRQLGREQVKEPGFLAHHYVLEGRGVVLADRLQVPVAYKRLQEEESKAPDETPVPHPVVVLPVALSGAPEVAKSCPPGHHKARKRYVPDETVHVERQERGVQVSRRHVGRHLQRRGQEVRTHHVYKGKLRDYEHRGHKA